MPCLARTWTYSLFVGCCAELIGCSAPVPAHGGDVDSLWAAIADTTKRIDGLEEKLTVGSTNTTTHSNAEYLRVRRRVIEFNTTGNEVCNEHGEACVFVIPTRSNDSKGQFWGYDVPSCNSRIVRDTGGCRRSFGKKSLCFLDRTSSRRARDATSRESFTSNGFCIDSVDGSPRGCSYAAAVCTSEPALAGLLPVFGEQPK